MVPISSKSEDGGVPCFILPLHEFLGSVQDRLQNNRVVIPHDCQRFPMELHQQLESYHDAWADDHVKLKFWFNNTLAE